MESTNNTKSICDLCDEKLNTESVCTVDGSICLCQNCFMHVEDIPENNIKSGIKRLLDRNVL